MRLGAAAGVLDVSINLIIIILILITLQAACKCCTGIHVDLQLDGGEWKSATATISQSLVVELARGGGGACGYGGGGDLDKSDKQYHHAAAAAGLSSVLFNRGSSCGGCFEVRCVDHILWCLQGSPSVILTVTDFCPPNYGLSADYGGWCNFPRYHFEMSPAAFAQIANASAVAAAAASEVVPVQYRRVKCEREGGVRFTVKGSSFFYQVLISNVGSDGQVVGVKIKGSKTSWIPMARNWGQNWHSNILNLQGQPLSFEVTTSSGTTLTSYNVAPPNWRFGQTFQGKQFTS